MVPDRNTGADTKLMWEQQASEARKKAEQKSFTPARSDLTCFFRILAGQTWNLGLGSRKERIRKLSGAHVGTISCWAREAEAGAPASLRTSGPQGTRHLYPPCVPRRFVSLRLANWVSSRSWSHRAAAFSFGAFEVRAFEFSTRLIGPWQHKRTRKLIIIAVALQFALTFTLLL